MRNGRKPCKGDQLPEWEQLKVTRGSQVVLKIRGERELVTARNKDQYDVLRRQRHATSEIKDWYVERIPQAAS